MGAGPWAGSLGSGASSLLQIWTPEPGLAGARRFPAPPCSQPLSARLCVPLHSSVKERDDRREDGDLSPRIRPQPTGKTHQDGLAEEAEVHREKLAAEVLRAEGTAALLLQGRGGREATGTSLAVCPLPRTVPSWVQGVDGAPEITTDSQGGFLLG